MKVRVLVFPCGSEIGLEIHNSLKYSAHIELYGASSISDHGEYLYKNYIGGLPYVEQDNFIDSLNNVVSKYNIDFIFPAHDSVVLKLAENSARLGCSVITSPYDTCRICRSKSKTYEVLSDHVKVPKVRGSDELDLEYPVFIKPDVGQGSKGALKIDTPIDLRYHLARDKTLLVLEYLPGAEYTLDCFTNKNRELLFVGARERTRISNGISVATHNIFDEKLLSIAKSINAQMVFRGAWFFQVKKRENGEYVLLEVAPRIAGSMGLHRNLGINLPMLSIYDALNIDTKVIINDHSIKMDRALTNRFQIDIEYKHVYIDLDDTIIINSCINPIIMLFIFQCFNNGIRVHLLSRHSRDVNETLRKYRIEGLFDSVTVIKGTDEKSNYITEGPAIFIDDSFKERLDVIRKCGIPTFDLSAVESLIDWKL